ncbi:amino acid ABC transporter substrate-binding protein [Chitinimonas arctica]|uniref:Amino acid ABC transporter substrate-binding protein n=1 Tax=Chitinimonas arctica TaxID=2594795 RepID=A0A516SBG4_9NEIS|nr:transporter substrate-binding domain-containing protein [Chitinimonas arctica]QDQ25491.1 amino acid ABC transporter substrate-binding protein [Chitinimonas arctica]
MRTTIFLAIASLYLPLAAQAAEKVVLYGDDDYPPYSYVEQGQFKGIYVDFLKRAAGKLDGYEVELKPVPWKRGLATLESGEAMALFPPYLRKERAYIQPYSVSMYTETIVIVCNEQSMSKPRKKFPEDFGDIAIGVNAGFVLSDSILAAQKAGTARIVEVKGTDANLAKLASNRIGCYANDRLSIYYALKKMKAAPNAAAEVKALKLNDTVQLSSEDAFVGFSAKNAAPYKADFINKLNAGIEKAKKENVVGNLISTYAM